MRFILFISCTLIFNISVFSQGCCSGGAGSPIAGGAATGVLQENQMEISINYQYNSSNKFFAENRDTTLLFNNLSSDYLFFRVDYGLSKKLTLSIASGYFLDKSKIGKKIKKKHWTIGQIIIVNFKDWKSDICPYSAPTDISCATDMFVSGRHVHVQQIKQHLSPAGLCFIISYEFFLNP